MQFLFKSIIIFVLTPVLLSLIFGPNLSNRSCGLFITVSLFFCVLFSIYFFFICGICGLYSYIIFGVWFTLSNSTVYWSFTIDSIGSVMLFVVFLIALLVHVYSIGYLDYDPHALKFFSFLLLFTFFMLILITADNFIIIFLGWEGIGFCSYLLVSFWNTRNEAVYSALKALLLNKFADLVFLVGLFLLFHTFVSFDYILISNLSIYFIKSSFIFWGFRINSLSLICFFLFFGVATKSAQLGMHIWLPDAMEGPLPASALLHSATMVKAGIFLLIKCSSLFECCPEVLIFMIFLGTITSLFTGLLGFFSEDSKRSLAYSTSSHLGQMFAVCGFSCYKLSFFYLINHAFFKALFFLITGSGIDSNGGDRDSRTTGGLGESPYFVVLFIIPALSSIGFPFFSSFYSKSLTSNLSFFCDFFFFEIWSSLVCIDLVTLLSPLSFFKSFLVNISSDCNQEDLLFMEAENNSFFTLAPEVILSYICLFFGVKYKFIFIEPNSSFFYNSLLFSYPLQDVFLIINTLPVFVQIYPILYILISFLVTYYFFESDEVSCSDVKFSSILLNNVYFYKLFYYTHLQILFILESLGEDFFLNSILSEFLDFFLVFSVSSYKSTNKFFFEILGPQGLTLAIYNISDRVDCFHNRDFYHYFAALVFSIVLFFILYDFCLA